MLSHIAVFIIIIFISALAYRLHSLSKSGAFAAIIVGMSIYVGVEMEGLILLGIFFGTSSLLSFYKSHQKKSIEEKLEKGSQRDWVQVLANGGIAAICSIFFFFTDDLLWLIAFLTSIASATGDTWSSEIGPLSKRPPRSVRHFKVVEPGTSGAISVLGTITAIIGVLLITVSGLLLLPITIKMAWIIFTFGILGNGIDTFLGAFYQRSYRCEVCSMLTEKQYHCDNRTLKLSGWSFLNNDGVNLLSSFISPLVSILTYHFLL
jgi:uncharacterized protein (TIGR00297 family)